MLIEPKKSGCPPPLPEFICKKYVDKVINMAEIGDIKCQNAKEKWKLLRNFIENKKLNVQHRRQQTFGLFKSRKMGKCEVSETDTNYVWLEYTNEDFPQYGLALRQRVRSVNWDDAIGFDNTGNICIWPSEEILSYLCMKNNQDFRDKIVCEVGAGMTGLAGMMLAIASDVKEIVITDGNMDSVRNLELMTMENKSKFGDSVVESRPLMWNKDEDYIRYKNYFDYVICADCLFYEQAHESLLDVMFTVLKSGGKVIILSPPRGNSIEKFIQHGKRTFEIEQVENYDDHLWSLYIQRKRTSPSCEAVKNFPVMVKLKKS